MVDQCRWSAEMGASIANLSLLNKLAKLTPIASAGVSAVYSWRLVDDVHQKHNWFFHKPVNISFNKRESSLSALTAYQR